MKTAIETQPKKYRIGIAFENPDKLPSFFPSFFDPSLVFSRREEFECLSAYTYDETLLMVKNEIREALIIDDSVIRGRTRNNTGNILSRKNALQNIRDQNNEIPMILCAGPEYLTIAADCELDAYVQREIGFGLPQNYSHLVTITRELINDSFSELIADFSNRKPAMYWQRIDWTRFERK